MPVSGPSAAPTAPQTFSPRKAAVAWMLADAAGRLLANPQLAALR
jgi:hypothetical protein